MQPEKPYLLMHNNRTVQALVKKLYYRMNVDTIHREEADNLEQNEIGRVKFETTQPIFFDPYKLNSSTGSFILVDPDTNVTLGAGMIRSNSIRAAPEYPEDFQTEGTKAAPEKSSAATKDNTETVSPNVTWKPWNIPLKEREKRNGHKAGVVWFTGISGAGKSTVARELEKKLWELGRQTVLLDGDQVRHGLCGDLGFSPQDRSENIRRAGHLARLFFEQGNIVICTFVSPYRDDRRRVRELFPGKKFLEIHVHCKSETAQQRDPKGLYEKAKRGELKSLTGYDAEYQSPEDAKVVDTDENDVQTIMEELLEYVTERH